MTETRLPVCIMGPTGSGKSALALALAERFDAEIITVDSAQVYRQMDIGTAKPSLLERQRVAHHLIDVCDPSEAYSVAQFVDDAERLITDISARGKLPLLVGGTMLYFRALQKGLAKLPSRNDAIRQRVVEEAALVGWPGVHHRLRSIDPDAAARIHSNDGQRIQRAIEVFELTGQTLSSLQKEALREGGWGTLKLILAPKTREALIPNLTKRLDDMWEMGFVAEVERLRARQDLHPDLPAIRSVGYRQIWNALAGQGSLEEAKLLTFQATYALAKRQYTWLNAEPNATWLDPTEADVVAQASRWLMTEQ